MAYSVVSETDRLSVLEKILEDRVAAAKMIRLQAEAFVNTVPQVIQRIIRYKIFEQCTWDQVAAKMEEGKSGDAYRKQLDDYLEKRK